MNAMRPLIMQWPTHRREHSGEMRTGSTSGRTLRAHRTRQDAIPGRARILLRVEVNTAVSNELVVFAKGPEVRENLDFLTSRQLPLSMPPPRRDSPRVSSSRCKNCLYISADVGGSLVTVGVAEEARRIIGGCTTIREKICRQLNFRGPSSEVSNLRTTILRKRPRRSIERKGIIF